MNMERYINLIIILAPGFIAQKTTLLLGNTVNTNRETMQQLMTYFMYSIFSIMLILSWKSQNNLPQNMIIYAVLGVIGGVSTGILWEWKVKKLFRTFVNYFNRKENLIIFESEDLINANMKRKEDHLIEIKKDGKRIAIGAFMGSSLIGEAKSEIKIDNHPVYAEWLDDERYKSLFPVKHSILNFTDGYMLIEYEYPENFFDENFNIEKIMPNA